MTSHSIAKIMHLAALIHEASWSHMNSRYSKTMVDCVREAIAQTLDAKDPEFEPFAVLISLLLLAVWEDALEWAEVVAPQKKRKEFSDV